MPLFLIPLMLVACGPKPADDSGASDDDDNPWDDTDGAECTEDGDCASDEICADDACEIGDRDNSPEEAGSLFWSEVVEGKIAPAGDEDWYAVETDGGEFIVAHTEDAEDDDVLDTVISIYDATGHLLAWEDEHPGGNIGGGYDSVCYAYLAEAGTYYVKVEDVGHFEGGTGLGGEDADYTLEIDSVGPASEPDSLQDAGQDYGTASENVWYSAQAVFEEAGDVDYIVLDVPETGMPMQIVSNAAHAEGSDATPLLTLYDEDGEPVLNTVAPALDGSYGYLPATRSDRYVLALQDADGGGGANHWAWGFFILREAWSINPDEQEPNDAVETATVLDMEDQEPDVGERWSAYGQGVVSDGADADVYAVEIPFDGAYVTVAWGSRGYGGALVPRLELLDATGAVVATADATETQEPELTDAGPFATGTMYLRVSAAPEGGSTGGPSNFYLFGVHASSTTD